MAKFDKCQRCYFDAPSHTPRERLGGSGGWQRNDVRFEAAPKNIVQSLNPNDWLSDVGVFLFLGYPRFRVFKGKQEEHRVFFGDLLKQDPPMWL